MKQATGVNRGTVANQTPISDFNDVVTIIRDPAHSLGKHFKTDGSKSASVFLSQAFAEQRLVHTAKAMAAVIREVSEDANAALINASFPAVPVGEMFVILSEKQFQRQLAIPERAAMMGVHAIKIGAKTYKAVARFKENTKASSWQLLDRDVDAHTPPEYANWAYQDWLAGVERILPGLGCASRITTLSSSARVARNGKAIGTANGHTWVQVLDSSDVERVRTALMVRAMEIGLTWTKPHFSRMEPKVVVGQGVATILDPSVWTPGRLVFNGKPTVEVGLTVKPQKLQIFQGTRLDTSKLITPDSARIASITRLAGLELRLRVGAGGALAIDAQNLKLDTELELNDGTITSVSAALKTLAEGEKMRCQAPFRDSQSMAAFLSRNHRGKPFVHDVGTNTTHWLNDTEAAIQGFKSLSEDGLPLDELITTLKLLSEPELRKTWVASSKHLQKDELEDVINLVTSRTGKTRRALNAALSEAANAHKSEQLQDRAAGRTMIFFTPEDLTALSATTEKLIVAKAAVGEYVSFGGILSQVQDKEIPYTHLIGDTGRRPPPVPVLELLDEVGMRAMVERVAVFQTVSQHGRKNIAVPAGIIDTLIKKKQHSAPSVIGLVGHPVVLGDGTIVSEDGLHESTHLFLHGVNLKEAKAYSGRQAKVALNRLRTTFLEGFSFASKDDEWVALSSLFTGVQRRLLDQAPGYAFLAPIASSGKTTLARRLHVLLTGRDMPVSSFPEGNDTEVQKQLLATLLRSPVMICLDNITDGTTFQSSAISAVMTSSVLTQRVLGLSRDADVPTNVLFVVTGNNLSLGSDEITRWLPVYLDPKTARPQERTFKSPDVVTHALEMRAGVLRDVIGIIAGYIMSKASMATTSRFARWDRMVRQPIIWAGGDDVAAVFRQNMENSESAGAAVALLTSLHALFGNGKFTAGEVASMMSALSPTGHSGPDYMLKESLLGLKARDPKNSRSAGRAITSVVNRRVPTSNGELILKSSITDGITNYRIGP